MSENEVEESGPLSERLVHKSWKVRQNGYLELKKIFSKAEDENDSCFVEYESYLKGMAKDNNAVAQEKGLDAILCFVENAKIAKRTAPELAGLLVEKGLGGRTNTKALASSILHMYIEIEVPNPVIDALLKGYANRVPKIVLASAETMVDVIRMFGPSGLPFKTVVKSIATLFGHSDQNVRKEAVKQAVEVYKYIGEAVFSSLDSLRPAQMKEVQDAIQGVAANSGVQERFTRSQKPATDMHIGGVVEGGEEVSSETVSADSAPAVDPLDFVDPVNVLSNITEEWFGGLDSKKWSERKEQLDNLVKWSDVHKIQSGDFGEVVRVLKKVVEKDNNVNCVISAVKCLRQLASGLRADFREYSKQLFSALIEKLKDKKQALIEEIRLALVEIFKASGAPVAEVLDEVNSGLKHKTPQVNTETLMWLHCAMEKSPSQFQKNLKQFVGVVLKATDSGSADTRECSFKCLGRLMAVSNERVIRAHLDVLDKLKMSKVEEYFVQDEQNSAIIRPALRAGPSVSSSVDLGVLKKQKSEKKPAAVSKSVAVDSTNQLKSPKPKKSSRPTSGVRKTSKPATAKGSALTGGASASGSSAPKIALPKVHEEHVSSPSLSDAEAEELLDSYCDGKICTQLGSSSWKERLEAVNSLDKTLSEMEKEDLEKVLDAVVVTLARSPGWKETNAQVLNKKFDIISFLAQNCTSFRKSSAVVVLQGAAEKFADMKLKTSILQCLTSLSEAVSPKFVCGQVFKTVIGHKNPKVTSEALVWVRRSIEEFGASAFDVPVRIEALIGSMKSTLEATNPGIKAAATGVLTALYKYLGDPLRDFLSDVKGTLLTAIYAEFDAVERPSPSKLVPQRKVRGEEEVSAKTSSSSADLLPRTDISSLISHKIFENLSSPAWATRQEALQEVESIITAANKRITGNIAELMSELKKKLQESNRNIVMGTLSLISLISTSYGPNVEKYSKFVLNGVISFLNDNKKPMRDHACSTLENWIENVPFSVVAPFLSKSLSKDMPQARQELLQVLLKFKDRLKGDGIPTSSFVAPVLGCLTEKSAETRKLAEELLQELLPVVGTEQARKHLRDMKPAYQQTLKQIIDKCNSEGPDATLAPVVPQEAHPRPNTARMEFEDPEQDKENRENRPVTAPARTMRVDRSSSMRSSVRTKESLAVKVPPFKFNGQKESRQKREKKMKWAFDEPRPEFVDFLKDQLIACVSEPLYSKMISPDFKQHLEAISEMQSNLEIQKGEVIDSLDLLLKWCALRLFDMNTASMTKTLEFVSTLFQFLEDQHYSLSDFEAASFFPFLIEKTGSTNTNIRTMTRNVLKLGAEVTSPFKMFSFAMEGLKSKNARSRVECLHELAILIKENGIDSVCNTVKTLPQLVALLSDRDMNVRQEVLNALVEVFNQKGLETWKLMGNVSDKEKSAVEERLKYANPSAILNEDVLKKQMKKKPSSKSNLSQSTEFTSSTNGVNGNNLTTAEPQIEQPKLQLDFDKIETTVSQTPKPPLLRNTSLPQHLLENPTPRLPTRGTYAAKKSITTQDPQVLIERLISVIGGSDQAKSVDAMKQICDRINRDEETIVPKLHDLINIMTDEVRKAFFCSETFPVRLCKYLLNTLMQLFSRKNIAANVSLESLTQLVGELLQRLLDVKLTELAEGQHLLRALNTLMLKILENSDRTLSFRSLLSLMGEESEKEDSFSQKYVELIVKCLLKLTKALSQTIDRIDVSDLLFALHEFLTAHPPSQYKNKDDLPLRTVKTILNELVRVKGVEIRLQLDKIPVSESPLIVNYIELMLTNYANSLSPASRQRMVDKEHKLKQEGQISSVITNSTSTINVEEKEEAVKLANEVEQTKSNDSSSLNTETKVEGRAVEETKEPEPETNGEDEDVNEQMSNIFKKIGTKEKTQEGLRELYFFRKRHPDADIQPFMSKCSDPFQSYILRNLEKIAAQENGKKDMESAGVDVPSVLQRLRETSISQPEGRNSSAVTVEDIKQRLSRFGGSDAESDKERQQAQEQKEEIVQPEERADAPATATSTISVESIRERLARLKGQK